MKRIVLLEDRPERLKSFVHEVNDGHEVKMRVDKVFYYNPTIKQESEEIKNLRKELDVPVQVVNIWNFGSELDAVYNDPDTLFIFDTDLKEDLEEEVFSYRINVNYAIRKKTKEPYKIWFYTVAGPYFETNIKRNFPGYVLDARLDSGQIDFNLRGCDSFRAALETDGSIVP